MFFKYATLLAFAATAIAGAIEPGVYRITNAASHSTARSYIPFSPVYVSSTREAAGPFELWDIRDAKDGSYTLQNVGLGTFAADTSRVITTRREGTAFNIESAGNDEWVIKLPYDNFVWNAEPPVIPRGNIELRPANGRPTEHWILSRSGSGDDYSAKDEQWELLQRIGRFLRQF